MYNKQKALRNNVEAIREARMYAQGLLMSPRPEVLQRFSGFGGLKEVLAIGDYIKHLDDPTYIGHSAVGAELDKDMKALADEIVKFAAWRNVQPDEVADSIKNSVLTAFYTPSAVVQAIASAVQHTLAALGLKAETFLEPSAGTGGFLSVASVGCKAVAIEKDVVTSAILSALHPDVEVRNIPFEQISAHTSLPSHFDVVASNIPFGDIPVHDAEFAQGDGVHQQATKKLHTYFFVKALERLNNGGILAFITSRGVADSVGNQFLRDWLVRNGNLLAAVRLPDTLFGNGSGIQVGSDLLIFQRDNNKNWRTTAEEFFCETSVKEIKGQLCGPVNRLLSGNCALYTSYDVVRNQYGAMMPVYQWRESYDLLQQALEAALRDSMQVNFRKSAWIYGHDCMRQTIDELERSKRAASATEKKSAADAVKRDEVQATCRPHYDRLMQAYFALTNTERTTRKEDVRGRLELNDAYDAFVEHCGTLHDNDRWLGKWFDDWHLALSLEYKNPDGTFRKADIFDHPTSFHTLQPGETVSPMEALAISLNDTGTVDMPRMEHLTGMIAEDVYAALPDEIFLTASEDGGIEWQHKSKVINGNVIERRELVEEALQRCTSASDFEKRCLTDTIKALVKATPSPIAYEDIDIQLGARWVPTRFFERFAAWLFEYSDPTDASIRYVPATDSFDCRLPWSTSDRQYACRYHNHGADENFMYALQDNCPTFTHKVGEHTAKDTETIRAVQKIIDYIRSKFCKYMASDAIGQDDRKLLADIYNRKFNATVHAKFDGSMQTFPDLDYSQLGFSALYPSQMDAIWMLKQSNGGVCWHEVGGGKTMIMCVAAYEMRRLGMCDKPLIIGMKANVQQIAETFRKAYPKARLLYPGEKDFSSANRRELFSKIANNDWDCIIMSHDQFVRLPQASDTEMSLLKAELQDLEQAIEMWHFDGHDRRVLRQMERSKERLRNSIADLQDRLNKRTDDALDFSQMGIDHIFVDEYHNFKNLRFNTRHSRVAGIGNNQGSDKSWKLLTAIRDIQKRKGRDLCASFFSGTIVSNALTELYVLFKYLCPKELAKQNMSCFDAWASNFVQKRTDYDLTITGEVKAKERFRTYCNVPELALQLQSITDYRTAEMINLDRPKANVIFDCQDPTPEQEDMLQRLCQYASNGHWEALGLDFDAPKNSDKALMLIATDIARKVSLDPRMLSVNLFSDHPMNKSSRCARKIAEYYRKYDEFKGTQFVFCDISTYDAAKWNIYSDVKAKLVHDYGIPAEEIAFVHQFDTERKREKLFDAMNDGRIRVLFGSTQKLGTGVNAQRRAVAVHHLDIPWRPSDLDQRTGRAVRKGNEVKIWGNNTVDVIIYGTNRTLDAYKFSLLKNKAMFINQIGCQTIGTRKIDEDQMDEDNGMNFAEYVALLSGNDDLLKKARLDTKIAALESERDTFNKDRSRYRAELSASQERLTALQSAGQRFASDLAAIRQSLATNDTLCIDGAKTQTPDDQAKKLHEWRADHRYTEGVEIGRYGDLTIMMFTINDAFGVFVQSKFLVKSPVSNMRYRCNERGTLGLSNEEAVNYFKGLTANIERLIANNEANCKRYADSIEICKFEIAREFDGAEELARLNAEREELVNKVDAALAAKEEAKQAAIEGAPDEQA